MSLAQMEQLFKTCDTRGTGYLDYEELRDLCSQIGINGQEADIIFKGLDDDEDGKVSFQDFTKGFANFVSLSTDEITKVDDATKQDGCQVWQTSAASDQDRKSHFREDHLADLYKDLQNGSKISGSNFENVIQDLLDSMRRLQEENKQLESSWKREKLEHERHIQTLEDEMDHQVKDIEIKAKRKAYEQVEVERKTLKRKMSLEMDKLQRHMSLFEKVESWLKTNHHYPEHDKLHELRTKVEQAFQENRQLRMSLLDTQTNVALMRSELLQIRALYEEKCHELDTEREKVMEVLEEQEHLSQQLHKLYNANQRLQDTNDSLRGAAFTSKDINKACHLSLESKKRGSVIGDYINAEQNARSLPGCLPPEAIWQTEAWEKLHSSLKSHSSVPEDLEHCADDGVDSGMSTLREVIEPDDDDDDDGSIHKKNLHISKDRPKQLMTTLIEGKSLSLTNLNRRMEPRTTPSKYHHYSSINYPASVFSSSDSGNQTKENSLHSACSDQNISGPKGWQLLKSPDRTYKVVFVGDAAVGKSSLILRLSKGVFIQNLNSTVGVDFQMKNFLIGGQNVAVQLWDTAGQERFRSITQSYFRKVDGIVVVYDCTSEQSFLNVRHWMDAISTATPRKIPIMLIGNKSDIRQMFEVSGKSVVQKQHGKRLARDYDVSFIETSAKEGTNVIEAIEILTRNMAENEDQELRSSVVCLNEIPGKKKKRCCS